MASSFESGKQQAQAMLAGLTDISGALPEIKEILESSIDLNFQVGGRFGDGPLGGGTSKWPMSERAEEEGGKTLVDSGLLAASTTVTITGKNSLAIGSNRAYAARQHFGFDGPDQHTEAHPIYVIQDEDLEDIEDVLHRHLLGKL